MIMPSQIIDVAVEELKADTEASINDSLDYLTHFGYMHSLPALKFDLDSILKWIQFIADAIKAFQRMAGIEVSGLLNSKTMTAMTWPRCGCPDNETLVRERMLQIVEQARWQNRSLKYYVRNYVPTIPASVQDDIIESVYKGWSQYGNIRVERTTSEGNANLVIFSSRIDGPGRVLAQAQLPPGNDQQLWLQMDSGDRFVESNPVAGEILYQNVFWHETWHNGGLDHSRRNDQLMSPFYSQSINRPQAEDIQRWQQLYGPPVAPPPPPPADFGISIDLVNQKIRAPRPFTFENF